MWKTTCVYLKWCNLMNVIFISSVLWLDSLFLWISFYHLFLSLPSSAIWKRRPTSLLSWGCDRTLETLRQCVCVCVCVCEWQGRKTWKNKALYNIFTFLIWTANQIFICILLNTHINHFIKNYNFFLNCFSALNSLHRWING